MNEDGTWLAENPADNPGFQRLDWLIEQCRAHNLYVILDLHGAPGGQSTNHSTGKAGRNTLYTEQSDMDTAVRLWRGIAEYYRDEPVVAAYDLLNEPQNNGDTEGVNNWEPESDEAVENTNRAYDTLYQAVRDVDPNHIISFEGIWSMKVLPDPAEHGYTNMLYQLHLYDTGGFKIRSRVNEMVRMRKSGAWRCWWGSTTMAKRRPLPTACTIRTESVPPSGRTRRLMRASSGAFSIRMWIVLISRLPLMRIFSHSLKMIWTRIPLLLMRRRWPQSLKSCTTKDVPRIIQMRGTIVCGSQVD